MKCRIILIALFVIMAMSCSVDVATDSVKKTPTPRQATPVTTITSTAGTPTSPSEKRPSQVIKGGSLCENYLLAKIGSLKARGTQQLKLKDFRTQIETLSPSLKKWLETADSKKLVSFELRCDIKEALVLGSRNIEATGLASNVEYWVVEIGDHSVQFQSLSDDPKLIFWDKDGLLNYYVVDFSSEFIEERDFDHPSLDLRRFVINADGKSQLVDEERNVKCE